MIFPGITQVNRKSFLAAIKYILIAFIFVSSYGCYTTRSDSYTTENIKTFDESNDVNHIILKDGTFISTRDKKVVYYEKYRDTSSVLVISPKDSVTINQNGELITIQKKADLVIPVSKVKVVYVHSRKLDAGKTILLTSGIVIVAAAVAFIAFLAAFAAGKPYQ